MTREEIANLNDLFRNLLRQNTVKKDVSKKQEMLAKVIAFKNFSNNKHEAGAFSLNNDEKIQFKIDYYTDDSYQHKAKKADKNCYRALTILKTEEF